MPQGSPRSRILASLEIPALILIAPALLFPSPTRLLVLAILPVIWLAIRATGAPVVPATPMNAALGLVMTMVGVSLFVTFDINVSLGKVAGMILGALLLCAIARWLTTPGRLRLATAAFIAAGAVLAMIGLLGTNWDNKFPAIGAITARIPAAIRGVPGAERGFSTNAVAGCLVLFVPLQLALLSTAGRWAGEGDAPRPLVIGGELLLLALTAGTLVLTESRTAWIGLALGGVAFLVWWRRWTRAIVSAGAVLAVGTVWTMGRESAWDFIVSKAGPAFVSTFDLRLKYWEIGIQGMRDYTLTGAGMNAFRKIMPVRYPDYPALPGEEVAHVHNHIVQAALDLGVPGMLGYLALWILAAVLLVLVYRQAGSPIHRVMASGLGTGLAAHFIFGLADVIPLGSKVGVLFWLTLALVVGLHRVALAEPGSARTA